MRLLMMKEELANLVFVSLFLPLLAGCTDDVSSETKPQIAEAPVLSLLDASSQASVDMSIKGEHRPVMLMVPPSTVVSPKIEIPPASVLEFGVGVSQDAWLRDGDGMSFDLSIRTPELPEPVQIYTRDVDPKNILEDQQWFDEKVSLSRYAGREVEFLLTTSAGEADDSRADWGSMADGSGTYKKAGSQ